MRYPPALLLLAALVGCASSEIAAEGPSGEEVLTFDAELLGQTGWKERRWGLRIGFFAPGQFEDEEFGSNVALGAFYQGLQLREKKIIFEIGGDYWTSSSDSGYVNSTIVFLRAEALFASWERIGSRRGAYLLSGVGVLGEFAHDNVDDQDYELYEMTFDVGVGWGCARSGWDVRTTYTFLPTSENTKGIAMLTTAYAF